ncbi:hypothetical protein DL771_004394 [Monosporascus sp. 5C6A]|nr:hypothetical protein DL771_004394 [Monosporascus sp. 5C6A]
MLVTRQCESEQHPWSSRFEALFNKATSPRMSSFNASAQEDAPDAQSRPGLSGPASDTGHSRALDPLGLRQPKVESPTQKSAETRDSKYSIKAEPAQDDPLASTDTPGLARGPTQRESAIAVERGQVISTDQGGNENAVVEKEEDDDVLEDDEMVEAEGEQPSQPQTAAERTAARRKMKRFRLTHQQTRFLMSEFAKQPHPDAAHRERLSREIPGLSPRQVQVWFQNSLLYGPSVYQPDHMGNNAGGGLSYESGSYSSAGLQSSPTNINYSSVQAPTLQQPQHNRSRLRAASANLPLGLDLRHQYRPGHGLQPSNHSSTPRAASTSPYGNPPTYTTGFPSAPLTAPVDFSLPRTPTIRTSVPDYSPPQMSAPIAPPQDFTAALHDSLEAITVMPGRYHARTGIQPETGSIPGHETTLGIRGDILDSFRVQRSKLRGRLGLSVSQRMESFQKTIQKLESANANNAPGLVDSSPSCTSFGRICQKNAVE